jgi:hypothetical protein
MTRLELAKDSCVTGRRLDHFALIPELGSPQVTRTPIPGFVDQCLVQLDEGAMVRRMGFEPMLSALKVLRLKPLA